MGSRTALNDSFGSLFRLELAEGGAFERSKEARAEGVDFGLQDGECAREGEAVQERVVVFCSRFVSHVPFVARTCGPGLLCRSTEPFCAGPTSSRQSGGRLPSSRRLPEQVRPLPLRDRPTRLRTPCPTGPPRGGTRPCRAGRAPSRARRAGRAGQTASGASMRRLVIDCKCQCAVG